VAGIAAARCVEITQAVLPIYDYSFYARCFGDWATLSADGRDKKPCAEEHIDNNTLYHHDCADDVFIAFECEQKTVL
jgi:hypothetical protein